MKPLEQLIFLTKHRVSDPGDRVGKMAPKARSAGPRDGFPHPIDLHHSENPPDHLVDFARFHSINLIPPMGGGY
jgi:hypothetical protein